MYIDIIGLILIDNKQDIISVILATTIMFIFAGCIFKGLFEYKKNNKSVLK